MKAKSPKIVGSREKTKAMCAALINKPVDRAVVIAPSIKFLMTKFSYTEEQAKKLLRG